MDATGQHIHVVAAKSCGAGHARAMNERGFFVDHCATTNDCGRRARAYLLPELTSVSLAEHHCAGTLSGSVKVNVEPAPTSLFTQIRPPCRWTNLRERASPSPVPSTLFAAVPTGRNFSNTAS